MSIKDRLQFICILIIDSRVMFIRYLNKWTKTRLKNIERVGELRCTQMWQAIFLYVFICTQRIHLPFYILAYTYTSKYFCVACILAQYMFRGGAFAHSRGLCAVRFDSRRLFISLIFIGANISPGIDWSEHRRRLYDGHDTPHHATTTDVRYRRRPV